MKLADLRKLVENHDKLSCECNFCAEYDKAEYDFKKCLHLTTDHAASSYGVPVLVDGDGIAYGVSDMTPIGDAMPLYHRVAARDGIELAWEDFGHTLVGIK